MSRVLTEVLPLHLEPGTPRDREVEEKLLELFTEAGRIVGRLMTPNSTITNLLRRLKSTMTVYVKDEVCKRLSREISTALEAGGIPHRIVQRLMMVFVNMLLCVYQ